MFSGLFLLVLRRAALLRSGEDALALGALAAAVAGTRALAILLELGLELLLGDMLLDKLLDREVYFVEEDDIGLRDKVGELGATPVDLDATEADILLDITSRARPASLISLLIRSFIRGERAGKRWRYEAAPSLRVRTASRMRSGRSALEQAKLGPGVAVLIVPKDTTWTARSILGL